MMVTGQKLYEHASNLIPGGTQLVSKRPERVLPDQWPAYYARAKGCDVWDLDGNHYVDFSHNGIGTCLLGVSDDDVDAEVKSAIDAGSMSTLICPEEVALAEMLCEMHPAAEMVRYCRTGGEAMAVAVRIARASTGRDKVAFCGYHGWHDWYLSANISSGEALDSHLTSGIDPVGVPKCMGGLTLPFAYNDLNSLKVLLESHLGEVACIVMEPLRGTMPHVDFLQSVRTLATEHGAVLIFDECTVGFRHAYGGSHLKFDVHPDLMMFAKAISNGYAMAAVAGRREVMKAAELSFISSSYWTERIGPTAAIATINKLKKIEALNLLHEISDRVRAVWEYASDQTGMEMEQSGLNPLPSFTFCRHPKIFSALFTQEMLKRGFLATTSCYVTTTHDEEKINSYKAAVCEVFEQLAGLEDEQSCMALLKGPLPHKGFKRLVK